MFAQSHCLNLNSPHLCSLHQALRETEERVLNTRCNEVIHHLYTQPTLPGSQSEPATHAVMDDAPRLSGGNPPSHLMRSFSLGMCGGPPAVSALTRWFLGNICAPQRFYQHCYQTFCGRHGGKLIAFVFFKQYSLLIAYTKPDNANKSCKVLVINECLQFHIIQDVESFRRIRRCLASFSSRQVVSVFGKHETRDVDEACSEFHLITK